MRLTAEGEKLHAAVRSSFEQLRNAVEAIRRTPRREALDVTVGPYMGARWLSPRLSGFWSAHPEIELKLHHPREGTAHTAKNVRVGIVWGSGGWPGMLSEPLFKAEMVPVCSPSYLRLATVRNADDLIGCATLLHSDTRQEWTDWLRAVGLPVDLAQGGPVFEDTNVMIEAAVAGQGVAIGTRPLIDDDLSTGRLALAHPRVVAIADTYHFVCQLQVAELSAVKAFRSWLRDEAARPRRSGVTAGVG